MKSLLNSRNPLYVNASNQMGEPYVFGAKGNNKWDCSGLSSMVLNRLLDAAHWKTDQRIVPHEMNARDISLFLQKILPNETHFYNKDAFTRIKLPIHASIFLDMGKDSNGNYRVPHIVTLTLNEKGQRVVVEARGHSAVIETPLKEWLQHFRQREDRLHMVGYKVTNLESVMGRAQALGYSYQEATLEGQRHKKVQFASAAAHAKGRANQMQPQLIETNFKHGSQQVTWTP